ncbi:MAG: hypothetical protein AAF961_06175, partial [Planctomycetota bacterium]
STRGKVMASTFRPPKEKGRCEIGRYSGRTPEESPVDRPARFAASRRRPYRRLDARLGTAAELQDRLML